MQNLCELLRSYVTLRNRDTMQQERIKIAALRDTLEERVSITSLLKKIAND